MEKTIHTNTLTPTSFEEEERNKKEKFVKSHRIYVTIESIIYKLRIEFNTQTLRLYLFSSRSKGIFTKKNEKKEKVWKWNGNGVSGMCVLEKH